MATPSYGGSYAPRYPSTIGGSKSNFESAISRISGGVTKFAPKKPEEGVSPYGGGLPWPGGSEGGMGQGPVYVEGRTAVPQPAKPVMPVYKAPEYDEGEVRSLSRKRSAPQVSKLRRAVQKTMARSYDNPNVQRMTLRDALAGYGEGLGSVTGAADASARQEYGQRYQLENQQALINYETQVKTAMQDWENSWNLYQQALSMTPKATSGPVGGYTGKLDITR